MVNKPNTDIFSTLAGTTSYLCLLSYAPPHRTALNPRGMSCTGKPVNGRREGERGKKTLLDHSLKTEGKFGM